MNNAIRRSILPSVVLITKTNSGCSVGASGTRILGWVEERMFRYPKRENSVSRYPTPQSPWMGRAESALAVPQAPADWAATVEQRTRPPFRSFPLVVGEVLSRDELESGQGGAERPTLMLHRWEWLDFRIGGHGSRHGNFSGQAVGRRGSRAPQSERVQTRWWTNLLRPLEENWRASCCWARWC